MGAWGRRVFPLVVFWAAATTLLALAALAVAADLQLPGWFWRLVPPRLG